MVHNRDFVLFVQRLRGEYLIPFGRSSRLGSGAAVDRTLSLCEDVEDS